MDILDGYPLPGAGDHKVYGYDFILQLINSCVCPNSARYRACQYLSHNYVSHEYLYGQGISGGIKTFAKIFQLLKIFHGYLQMRCDHFLLLTGLIMVCS